LEGGVEGRGGYERNESINTLPTGPSIGLTGSYSCRDTLNFKKKRDRDGLD
jgi:hypothetical protein